MIILHKVTKFPATSSTFDQEITISPKPQISPPITTSQPPITFYIKKISNHTTRHKKIVIFVMVETIPTAKVAVGVTSDVQKQKTIL